MDHSRWWWRWRRAVEASDRLLWAVRIRWLVIGGFLTLGLAASHLGVLPSARACVWGALIGGALNAINHWSVTSGRYRGRVTAAAVFADQIIITFVVVSTGGIGSPFVMMYVVQVVTTAMLVNLMAAVVSLLWAVLLWAGWLTAQGLDLVAASGASLPGRGTEVLPQAVWVTFLLYCLALLAYLGGYISERLQESESDLSRKNRELEEALTSQRLALDRLRQAEAQLIQAEKMRGLGQLVAGVAHELNNPISFVLANVEHVRRYVDRIVALLGRYQDAGVAPDPSLADARRELRIDAAIDDLPEVLSDCEEGARRCKQIVDDLRLFSRGEEPDGWQRCDLNDGLERTIALLGHRLGKAIRVHRVFAPNLEVDCHPGQVNQVFMNLIANAADAIGDRAGNIWISTGWSDDGRGRRATVEIRDDGAGIPPDIQGRIAEPFFTTKPVGQGTGLGLSICHGIVMRHRGTLTFRSTGEGTTFELSLPERATD